MSLFTTFCEDRQSLWVRILLAALLVQKETLSESEMLE